MTDKLHLENLICTKLTFALFEIMVELFTTPLQLSEPGNHYNFPCKRNCHYNWQFVFFQIQVSEHNSLLCGGELHDTFSAKFDQRYHTILAINCVMHQISSLIWNEHDKLMAKMTILFLLYGCTAWFSYKWPIVMYNTLHLYDGSKLTTCILNYVPNSVVCKNLPVPRIYWSSSH